MASDTDNEDEPEDTEQTTPQRHRHQQKEDIIFDTCSDGSVYVFTNGNTAAGYAAVTELKGVWSIKRYLIIGAEAPRRALVSSSPNLSTQSRTPRTCHTK